MLSVGVSRYMVQNPYEMRPSYTRLKGLSLMDSTCYQLAKHVIIFKNSFFVQTQILLLLLLGLDVRFIVDLHLRSLQLVDLCLSLPLLSCSSKPLLSPSLYSSSYLSLCISLYLSVSLYLSLDLSVSLAISICPFVSLFIPRHLFISLSLLVSLCLSVSYSHTYSLVTFLLG